MARVEPPVLTGEQRREYAARAAARRSERAAVKRAVKAGEVPPREALHMEIMGAVTLRAFLACLPGVGGKKAVCACADMGIRPERRIRGLGSRQVATVERWLEERER